MSFLKFLTGKGQEYTSGQLTILVILRVLIGWHFLYEGLVKILNANWSSAGYLIDSQGFLSGVYESMALNQGVLNVVDFLNVWGLTAIGLGLILGLFSRFASLAGIILLAFYYFSHPPFIGAEYAIPTEGNYLIVNKTLIEMFTLWALYFFPTGIHIGLDRLLVKGKTK